MKILKRFTEVTAHDRWYEGRSCSVTLEITIIKYETCYEGIKEQRYSSTLSLTQRLDGVDV
jgi:hypothetical protein